MVYEGSQRLDSYGVIAAAFSSGPLVLSVHQGKNNSLTFWFFLVQLLNQLQDSHPDWRDHYVIYIDNATFHRSTYVTSKLEEYQVPVLYSGPYSYDGAPVERVFA